MKRKKERKQRNNCKQFTKLFDQHTKQRQKEGFSQEGSVIVAINQMAESSGIEYIKYMFSKFSNSFSDHNLALGYVYLMHCLSQRIMIKVEGQKKFYFNLIWPLKEIEVAAKHLEKSVRAHPNSALLYKLLMSCYNILSDSRKFDKACKKFKRYYDDLNSLDVAVIAMLHGYFSKREIARNAELSLYINHKLDEKMKELEQIVEMDPKFYPAIVPLLYIYADKSKLDEYATLLQRWADYCDSPIAYEGLGRVFLKNKYYEQAFSYFENAIFYYHDYNRKIICTILKELSRGLHYWQNNIFNYRFISSIEFQHFTRCANMVKTEGIRDLEVLQYLPSAIDIGIQCFSLFQVSKDLFDVIDKASELYQKFCDMLPPGRTFDQYFNNLQTINSPLADFIYVSGLYLSYLAYMLQVPLCVKRIKPFLGKQKKSERNFWHKIRHSMSEILMTNIHFNKGKNIIKGLCWLENRLKNCNIATLTNHSAVSIVNRMREYSVSFAGGLKSERADKITAKIDELQFSIKKIRSHMDKKFDKAIVNSKKIERQLKEISSLKFTKSKKAEDVIAAIESTIKKKIEILTNVDDKGRIIESPLEPNEVPLKDIKEFIDTRKNDKDNYLLWIIEESIEGINEDEKGIFIKGNRCFLSDIPRVFLLILIESPNIRVPYVKIWEAVSPTDKGHYKLKYTDNTNDRMRIHRWLQRLKDDTKTLPDLSWNNYIINEEHRRLVRGHKPGFSISGYTFKPGNEKFIYVYPLE